MIRPLAPFTATLEDTAQLIGASLNGGNVTFTGVTHVDSDVEDEKVDPYTWNAPIEIRNIGVKQDICVQLGITQRNLDW